MSMTFRIIILFLLVTVSIVVGIYFHTVLHTDIIYTHFLYIPIVLACMWWGRKGIFVAGLLAAAVFSFHLFGISVGSFWDDGARILFFTVVAFFVGLLSERIKSGQEALSLSEQKYRYLIDNSLAGIFVYSDERILFANSRLCDILAFDAQRIVGASIWDLIYDEDIPKVKQLVAKRKEQNISDLHYECRYARGDGRIIWVDVLSSLVDYEGQQGVLVNIYDITERREAERRRLELSELTRKQEEQLVHSTRLAELGEMAASISHELNQPLTGIRNYARNASYMIETNAGSLEDVRDNLQLISEQVDRASKIINQMRELARRSEPHFAPIDVNNILRESIEFLSPQMRLSGVDVRLELSREIPSITGDRIRLEQVFLNLMTNARQAMEDARDRRLDVRTYLDSRTDLPIVIEISDTGKGFTQEEASKLFVPFFTTKKTGHGTGLGLSISLSIVRDHKGTIEARGVQGRGATFTVRLPRDQEVEKRQVE
jgi:PAS domain S-box-containing protein